MNFSRSVDWEELPNLAERDFSQIAPPALVPLCLIMHPQSGPNALLDFDLPARRGAPVRTRRLRDRRSGTRQVGLGGMGRAGRAGKEAEEREWGRQGKHFAFDEVICG